MREVLEEARPSIARAELLGQQVPYAFAAPPEQAFQGRLETGLRAVAATLDLATLPAEAPLCLGSSSLVIGLIEGLPWPLAPEHLPVDDLDERIRQAWGLRNTGWTFSSACLSSAHALDAAARLIATGATEEALVIGVEVFNRLALAGFSSLRLLAPDHSRPLDLNRNGMVLGEAIAAVRLQARPSAFRIHLPALALDTGNLTGHSEDGSTIAAVMAEAIGQARLHPNDLLAVKAQASGSPGADAIEARALRQIFGTRLPAIFSMKAALGHTLGASGVAELAALRFCAEARWLPPTAGFSTRDDALGLIPLAAPMPWERGPVLFNLQGFGGGLASWVVEPC
ncbi:MAG: beta-ketoacyl synthase [Firmicutes bacterium]|nr:beta-ketoacyl synthase [Bacillota bacterium]